MSHQSERQTALISAPSVPAPAAGVPLFARRGLTGRERIDRVLDQVRLKLDSRSFRSYQPLPWDGDKVTSLRMAGCVSRWEAIAPVVRELEPASAIDVGAAIGWFSFKLGSLGITTLAVEDHPPLYRTILYGIERTKTDNVGLLAMTVNPATVGVLPDADCVLLLSVWHHFVRSRGLDSAELVLSTIWSKTRKVLFFETGESEMPPEYGLPPMEPDARTWIASYLASVCEDGTVRHLGRHDSSASYKRNLFAVVRDA